MLLSPEISVGQTEGASLGRGLTLRFEDFLLVIIGLSWFAKNAVYKELGLFLRTPLKRTDSRSSYPKSSLRSDTRIKQASGREQTA